MAPSRKQAPCALRNGWVRGTFALANARIAANKKASNTRALLEAVPRELHGDTGYLFSRNPAASPRGKFHRGRPAHAGRAEGPCPAAQSRRMVDRAAASGAQDARRRRTSQRLPDCEGRSLPSRDIYKTEQEFTAGWIALRFLNDPAVPPSILRASASAARTRRALARAGYWQGRAAEAGGRAQEARAAFTRAASNPPATTASWRAPNSDCRRSN